MLPKLSKREAEKMQQKFGLGLGKDEGYSKLIVLNSNVLAGCIFAPSIFMGVLTGLLNTIFNQHSFNEVMK